MSFDMTLASLALLCLVAIIIVVMTATRRVNYSPDKDRAPGNATGSGNSKP